MLNIRIRELRMAHGLNQVELAKKLSVRKQTVSNWENSNIQPSVDMLERIADCFSVTTDYLLGREDKIKICVDGLTDVKLHILNKLFRI